MKHLVGLFTALLLLLLCGNTARSTTITWTNANGGNWSVAANWSPNQAPGPGDTVYITNYAVTLDLSADIGRLNLAGGTLSGAGSVAGANTLRRPLASRSSAKLAISIMRS